jgi:hypothetical protein
VFDLNLIEQAFYLKMQKHLIGKFFFTDTLLNTPKKFDAICTFIKDKEGLYMLTYWWYTGGFINVTPIDTTLPAKGYVFRWDEVPDITMDLALEIRSQFASRWGLPYLGDVVNNLARNEG